MRILAACALVLLAGACIAAHAEGPELPRTEIDILPADITGPGYSSGVPDLHYLPEWEWQALVYRRKCELEPVKLSMTPVEVHPHDGDPLPGYVYRIDGELDVPPLVLLHDLPEGARDRPETWLHAGLGEYPASSTAGTREIDIPVPGDPARIVPRYAGKRDDNDTLNVWLETKSRRQLLSTITVDGMVGPSGMARGPQLLRWAGDLDGDDKLDLIVNFSSRAGEHSAAWLYLSSVAKEGEVVGLAAVFYYSPVDVPGC